MTSRSRKTNVTSHMRDTMAFQGVRSLAPLTAGTPISSSSCCETSRLWAGVSRNEIHHQSAQAALATPSATKAARQPQSATMPTTRGGAAAPPSLAKLCVTPCAMPRSCDGNQKVMARVAAGKAPPSPRPTMMRTTISDSAPLTAPVSKVAADQMTQSRKRTRRGP